MKFAECYDETYNFICISGGFGVGKTHLLLSIRAKILEHNPKCKVLYINMDTWTEMFIEAVRNEKTFEFVKTFYNYEVFLFEHIHELSGKSATAQWLYILLKNLLAANKKVAITYATEMLEKSKADNCDKPIKDMIHDSFHTKISLPERKLLYQYLYNNINCTDEKSMHEIREKVFQCKNFYEVKGLVNQLNATETLKTLFY